jgi:HemX protein
MKILIAWSITAIYGVVGYFYWKSFYSKKSQDLKTTRILFIFVLFCHLGLLISQIIKFNHLPIINLSQALSTFVWLTGITYLTLEYRLKNSTMGIFIIPIFLLLLIVSNLAFPKDEVIPDVLRGIKFEIHVISMLLAYGSFTLSFISSLLILLFRREIRKKNLGPFYSRVPSLPFFDKISNAAVDIGLIFSTIGILLGIYYAINVWENFLFGDLKFSAAFITWIIYVFHFGGRKLAGWQASRSSTISIVGFGWLLFSFVIISLFFTRLHQFT